MSIRREAVCVTAMLCLTTGSITAQGRRIELKPVSVGPEDGLAAAAVAHHAEQHNVSPGSIEVLPVPGMGQRVVLSGRVREPGGWALIRLVLLERADSGFAVLSRSEHMGDAYSLEPKVFSDGQTLLVLADRAAEYSYGLSAFVIEGDAIVTLPEPNVAVETDHEFGFLGSALPYVSAYRTTGGYELEFDTDLVLDPGGRGQTLLCRSDSRITLVLSESSWHVRGATEAPDPAESGMPPSCS